jgi:hypothetical protein
MSGSPCTMVLLRWPYLRQASPYQGWVTMDGIVLRPLWRHQHRKGAGAHLAQSGDSRAAFR